jgi:hypothetical protein
MDGPLLAPEGLARHGRPWGKRNTQGRRYLSVLAVRLCLGGIAGPGVVLMTDAMPGSFCDPGHCPVRNNPSGIGSYEPR